MVQRTDISNYVTLILVPEERGEGNMDEGALLAFTSSLLTCFLSTLPVFPGKEHSAIIVARKRETRDNNRATYYGVRQLYDKRSYYQPASDAPARNF